MLVLRTRTFGILPDAFPQSDRLRESPFTPQIPEGTTSKLTERSMSISTRHYLDDHLLPQSNQGIHQQMASVYHRLIAQGTLWSSVAAVNIKYLEANMSIYVNYLYFQVR